MPATKKSITELLDCLRAEVGQNRVSIRIDCENLETVFLEQLADGRLLVYDRYETLSYIREHSDTTYMSMNDLGIDRIRQICDSYRVTLADVFPDDEYEEDSQEQLAVAQYIHVEDTVADVVQRVSGAIDAIFEAARN